MHRTESSRASARDAVRPAEVGVISWALLTGEYPPAAGGVADYTRQLARGLAGAGDEVEVWAPRPREGELARDPGVTVHPLPDHLGLRSLALLERELAMRPRARLFVQYVPHILGMRAMNLPLCLWLAARRQPTWVLFHEVAFPFLPGAPWKHHVLSATQRAMATIASRGADRTFVTVPGWNAILRGVLGRQGEWLPIPSNVPTHVAPEVAARTREALGLTSDQTVLAHFSTYHASVIEHLAPVLRALLAGDPRRVALLLGRGSKEFAARELGPLGARVMATGPLEAPVLAAHLASSDLVVQPYSDGVSSRRTTAMAALALGKPLLTNDGIWTDPIWREGDVALATDSSVEALLRAAEPLLADPASRHALGARGLALYNRAFSLARLIRCLRA